MRSATRAGWGCHTPPMTTDLPLVQPFIEGAWMTKYGGRYYLQYGAPGTEYNVYANGVYVGTDPMGPFTYAPYNPVAYKPGGFVQGAGHGNTFQDLFGNWWNTGTPWIAVNWNFERRIGLHPAGFDADSQMYADTRFGDFPHWLPTKKWQRSDELLTQVAEVLREHPEIKKVEVQGHTDNRGAAAYNKKLSDRRAKSVVRWLVERGHIDADRLEPKGYGMDQPIDDNSTEEGRQRNRRVQFKIVSQDKRTESAE